MNLQTGQTVHRYRIESVLGQGGMAIVYKVRHEQLGSEHALKVLLIPSAVVRERLMQEGRVQARIRHPNLVSVSDVLEIDHAPALVMEYVNGPPLDRWLTNYRPSLSEGLSLFRGIVRGVGAAHREGRVHRDLKPGNVLLSESEDGLIPKVTDFGLVKVLTDDSDDDAVTQTGMGMGTPQYMAPEQIRDASQVDQRADMFALGCLLYELVCGRRAFDGPDALTIFNKVVQGDYRPPESVVPDLPSVVVAAIQRLLMVDPARRPANCDVLLDMLYGSARRDLAGDFTVPVRPAGRTRGGANPTPQSLIGLSGDDPTPILSVRTITPPPLAREPTLSAPSMPSLPVVEADGHSTLRAALLGAAASAVVLIGTFALVWFAMGPGSAASQGVAAGTEVDLSEVAGVAGFISALGSERVELVGRGERYRPGDQVPPGRYVVFADFPGAGMVEAGEIQVRASEVIRLRCTPKTRRCLRD